MLINTPKNTKNRNIVFFTIAVFLILAALKLTADSKSELFGSKKIRSTSKSQIDDPIFLSSGLFAEDVLNDKKNEIYTKENFSLYLNNELGAPTLMAVYKNSISDIELNGRFLAFLYLKNPTKWRAVNKRYDHIKIQHDYLIPVTKKLEGDTYYIFKIRLAHPYFEFDNLQKLEFVRHDPKIGRFTELFFEKDDLPTPERVSNTLQNLRITLKSKALEKLTQKRNEALESGILVSNDEDFVKAEISADGQETAAASIRLKGDWTDHLEHPNKWSYRIVPKGEKTIFGMRKFSIQHPKSRNYVWEWLINKVVKDNDITGLRYEFLNVEMKLSDTGATIPMGIMALEESFDKILIENNKRREGLIFGFDETMIWDDRKQVKDLQLDYPEDLNRPFVGELPIKIYNENKTLSDPGLSKQFQVGKNLIVGLRDNKLKLSEAFDVDKLAFYIALCNLFGADHGLLIENIRIYYNPVTHKLEPISFDSNSGFKVKTLREYPIGIADDLFRAKLVENYEKVSSKDFINGFLKKYTGKLEELSLELTGEFNEAGFDIDILQHNANLIRKKIYPKTTIQSTILSNSKNSIELEIKNFSEFPVLIDGLVLANGKSLNQANKSWSIAPNDTLNIDFRLKDSFNNAFVSKKNKEGGFRFPKDLAKIQVSHHLLGSGLSRRGEIRAFDSSFDLSMVEGLAKSDNLKDFDFIEIDESTGIATFAAGEFDLNQTLFIPSQYVVHIEPGFQLDLSNEASIISYAPFICKGTEENPIRFTSDDKTGGGIFVTSTSEQSIMQHTYFIGLSVPKVDFWELSGSVNFNEATVALSHCVFEKKQVGRCI